MKRESRVLVLDSVNGLLLCVVLRGELGIEHVMAFNSCRSLIDRMLSKRGVWGEVTYLVTLSDACSQELSRVGLRQLDPSKIPSELIDQVKVIKNAVARSLDMLRMIEVLSAEADDDKPTR